MFCRGLGDDVDLALSEPNTVGTDLWLQPAGQGIGGFNQEEVPVIVPHLGTREHDVSILAASCSANQSFEVENVALLMTNKTDETNRNTHS